MGEERCLGGATEQARSGEDGKRWRTRPSETALASAFRIHHPLGAYHVPGTGWPRSGGWGWEEPGDEKTKSWLCLVKV